MDIEIKKLTKQDWYELSENSQKICFASKHDPSLDRIDFALLAVSPKNIAMGFITVREITSSHIYWQFGGTFPGTQGTYYSYLAYVKAKEWCAPLYKSVSTYIENNNVVMLKFAMKLGFRIVGIKHVFNETLVELFLSLGVI